MNGLGIVASDLVPPGTITVMLHGSEVRIAPVETLREIVEPIGSENVEGLSTALTDFEKLQPVVERQNERSPDPIEDAND
jgi:hypothetical protein